MNDDDWYRQSDEWGFDPLDMERYEWLNNHYFHGLLKPNHHLSIERNGHRSILVKMMWMAKLPHDLIQVFDINTSEDAISFSVTKVQFDGHDAADLISLPHRAQAEIGKVEDIYGLARRLKRLEPALREHCARGALEYWRRLEITSIRAETEFGDHNIKVISLWQELQRARSKGHRLPEDAYEEGLADKRVAYMQLKAAAERLCLTADKARHAADGAKSDAMLEVTAFRSRFPDVTLPVDEFLAVNPHDRGSRMGM